MKIALLGYGKMGKAIEQYCLEQTEHQIIFKLGYENREELTKENLQLADVAIDFSSPETAVKHIRACFDAAIPIVSGSTGWLEQFETIQQECLEKKQAFFYASNYSVGVHLFWKITSFASQLMNGQDYSAQVDETHHVHKKDAPSGTAITTAEKMIQHIQRLEEWKLNTKGEDNELPIYAHRVDEVPGTHIVTFDNPIDTIKIEHLAKSRLGFVTGAVKAAEFLKGKQGVYGMDDLLEE